MCLENSLPRFCLHYENLTHNELLIFHRCLDLRLDVLSHFHLNVPLLSSNCFDKDSVLFGTQLLDKEPPLLTGIAVELVQEDVGVQPAKIGHWLKSVEIWLTCCWVKRMCFLATRCQKEPNVWIESDDEGAGDGLNSLTPTLPINGSRQPLKILVLLIKSKVKSGIKFEKSSKKVF